jgi:hypothetical protein
MKTLQERLREKIDAPVGPPGPEGLPFDSSACWLWRGAKSRKVRGRSRLSQRWEGQSRPVIKVDGRVVYVFRLMLSMVDGIPLSLRSHLQACHRAGCDNPDCVNPVHGYWGTQQDNHTDRAARAAETFLTRAERERRKGRAA